MTHDVLRDSRIDALSLTNRRCEARAVPALHFIEYKLGPRHDNVMSAVKSCNCDPLSDK
jgi:hypothetical protein